MQVIEAIKRKLRWCLKRRYFNKTVVMRGDEDSRRGLLDLIAWFVDASDDGVGAGKALTMVEIGSYQGESARMFLDSGKVGKLYCVDPWQMNFDKNDVCAFTDMSRIEQAFDRRVGGDTRVVKVKGTIDTLVALLEGGKDAVGDRIDVVYVDGCHTYEAVKYDLEKVLTRIKPRIVCGHDFSERWSGCKRAVLESVGTPDATFCDTSWAKRL